MGNKITGIHSIEEALKSATNCPAKGATLYLVRNDKRNKGLENLALAGGKVAVKKVSDSELDKMVGHSDHRGAVLDLGRTFGTGSVNEVNVRDFCSKLKDESVLVLALDGITDPHNIGAILRSADQFSVALVLLPEHRSASVNETVIRISSGASAYVRLATVKNLVNELEFLKKHGFWIYGADMDGDSSYNTKFAKRSVIVMGSEGSGIRSLVRSKCDFMVSIPMTGHIDSLNVSVATGILLYEYRRSNR